jgi:hypothetical protein
MARTSINIDVQGLGPMLAITDPKLFNRSTIAALRKTGSTARTQAAKEIGANYNLKASRIKRDILPARPTPEGLSIVFRRKPAPTIRAYGAQFKTSSASARSSSRGITTWKEFKNEQKTTSSKVFWRRSKSGKILPFVGSSSGLTGPFYPKGSPNGIRVLYGPSIGSIFARDSKYGDVIRSQVLDKTQEAYMKNIEAELARIGRGF